MVGIFNEKSISIQTLKINKQDVVNINEKGKSLFKNEKAYIGLAGKDYTYFWEMMDQKKQEVISEGEAYAFKMMLGKKSVKCHKFNWYDTGNLLNLTKTQNKFKDVSGPNILEKENEAIWFVNQKVIKFSTDLKFIKNRYLRSKKLKNFVPKVLNIKKNMYSYNKVEGEVFSKIINIKSFEDFLIYCEKFWKKKKLTLNQKKFFL